MRIFKTYNDWCDDDFPQLLCLADFENDIYINCDTKKEVQLGFKYLKMRDASGTFEYWNGETWICKTDELNKFIELVTIYVNNHNK